ncbi:MAG: HD domain-containing protein [Treponema sp.]|nr:HD domain-containing protein [Spirochaetia bacterium]MDD7015156.1 HD domain-containing protein [Spirochaetales bacterium]MDY4902598.1 HD domain-containing protein [Treponema sp.]
MKKELVLKIFEGFSIERWNDLIRPFDVVEMDKAAEKMVASYIIAKYEENRGVKIDWEWMIYASLFDLLRKIQLCDIKSPVQSIIKNEYPQEFIKLNNWVLDQYRNLIDDSSLMERFEHYIRQRNGEEPFEENQEQTCRIFRAAHKYSTLRELEMISAVNEAERLEKIRLELNADLQQYLDLRGLQLLITKQKPFDFIMRIEQLRFQTRWNQTPRIPKTSVLGHCFFVAVLTLLFTRESKVKMCRKRIYNNFFSALFHDLPESVTRDIISPVKKATDGLPAIVKNIEDKIVANELVPFMEDFYRDEILYFTSDEFENRVCLGEKIYHVSFEDLNEKYNFDELSPVDGKMVRVADHLSALLEAGISIKHGITSTHLEEGKANLLKAYQSGETINGIDAASIFKEFSL